MTQQSQYRCVQFIHYDIVHRAAFAMHEDQRRYEVWQDEFEREYNVKFGQLKVEADRYTVIFPSDEDYTLFMLRWA